MPDGDRNSARIAVDHAELSAGSWGTLAPRARADLLMKVYWSMNAQRETLASMISRENGKSIQDAVAEVSYAADFFRWYAEETVRPGGQYGPNPAGGARTIVTSRPVGIAALITPWNFPAAMVARKVAPALAAGCTVVLKPAAETPLTALAMQELMREAEIPDGVVNTVTTTDPGAVVDTWLQDDRVRKLSFTGSTGVGRHLLRRAADRVINCSMELGGNAPFVVTDDAEVEAAVEGAMIAKFRGGGQACTAADRFYIHEKVYKEFVGSFGRRVEALRTGPAPTGAQIGPLISARAVGALAARVQEAVEQGATISHRGESVPEAGSFFQPTVLVDVEPHSAIVQQENFGPVAPIMPWSDEQQVLDAVNGTDAGLASYVFTGDVGHGIRLAEAFDAGMVGINRGAISDPSAPFGGTRSSGVGREGARAGLEAFTETQYFNVDWPT